MNQRKVVQMLIGPASQTWQSTLLALCDDGTIWQDLGPHSEPRWFQLQTPPGCIGATVAPKPSELVGELRRLDEEARLKSLKATDANERNWFMGEEIAYNVAAKLVAERFGVE